MKEKSPAMVLLLLSCSCVQTDQLYSVRDMHQYKLGDADDAPRVDLVDPNMEIVKPSFHEFLLYQCGNLQQPKWMMGKRDYAWYSAKTKLEKDVAIKMPLDGPPTDWAHQNWKSYVCGQRIAAYAVDQCIYMAKTQNQTSGTANILVGTASVTASLATDALALAHPGGGSKTASAALAAAVASNAKAIPGVPNMTTVNINDITGAIQKYGEAEGLSDDDFKDGSPVGGLSEIKLARLHDAALSVCAANQYGFRKSRIYR